MSEDILLPREFPGMESLVHYRTEVSSTMELASQLATAGCAHGTLAIADRQQLGRGRMTRHWESAEGGLYFTLVLRPAVKGQDAFLYNFAAALALVQAIDQVYCLPAGIKWPNDVLVEQKKVAGILLEMQGNADRIDYLNIGIGINVNNQLPSCLPQAASLLQLSGSRLPRKNLLLSFLACFQEKTNPLCAEEIITGFREHCTTIGRQVNLSLPGGKECSGLALGIADNGALQIGRPDGEKMAFYFGDCLYQE